VLMDRRVEAAQWFRKALQVEPNYPRAVQGLRQCGSMEPSKSDQERMERLAHDYPEATRVAMEAVQWLAIARFDEALTRFNEAVRLAPSVPAFHDMKAECLNHMGRSHEALEHSVRATDLDPTFVSAWVSRAWANLGKEDFAEALRCSEHALSLSQNHDMAWNNAGAALMLLGRFREALERFDKALALNANNVVAAENRAACRRQLQHHDFTVIGADQLDLARLALQAGKKVAVIFDFELPNIDWSKVIVLTQEFEALRVIDLVDRSLEVLHAMANRLQQQGGNRLALDLTIRAKQKQRDSL